jgi:acetaldehyde dehydrogenase/alcohol dehydrogenase
VAWLDELKATLGIPPSIASTGISEADFLGKVDVIAAGAFDDQCTAANPRSPLIAEIRQLLLDSYYGKAFVEVFARQG